MKRLIIFLMSGICLASCSIARFQPVQRDSIYVARVDSVMVFDSVYIDRIRTIKEKSDTIYVTDWKTETRYRYRDRVKVDTLIQEKVVTEVREVEKKLSRWQRFRLDAFWYLAAIIAGFILWKSRKLWLHL